MERHGEYLIVPVPEGSKSFVLVQQSHHNDAFVYIKEAADCINLPSPGKYEIVGVEPTKLTEEEAKEIVECRYPPNKVKEYPNGIWKNYMADKSKYGALECLTARESLSSLIKANGLSEPVIFMKLINKQS